MIETLIAGVTAFDIYYANLPEYAYSYDGEARSISQFYDQKIPNVYVGGRYKQWNYSVNTGVHTKKLNTASVSLGYTYEIPLKDKAWSAAINLTHSISYASNTPCTDSYGREYLCTTLTAWSDHKEDKFNETSKITISTRYRF